MHKYLIILGPPGSGKGTQAKKIAASYGYQYFGTGELMRKEAEKGTPLGSEFKKVWDKGQGGLVDEGLVLELVKQEFHNIDSSKKILFDGYPRRIAQAEYLDELLQSDDIMVINLEVDEDELVKRMTTRKICSNCKEIFEKPDAKGVNVCLKCGGKLIVREEDKPEVVRKRIAVYNQETKPLLDYYQNKGLLVNVDGNPPIDVVTQNIEKVLND